MLLSYIYHNTIALLDIQEFSGGFLVFVLNNYIFELVQIVVWRFLQRSRGSDVLTTKQALLFIILLQYFPRFIRILPLTSELKRTTGVFAETAWAGAVNYLLLYMLASHVSTYSFGRLCLGIGYLFLPLLLFLQQLTA